MVDLLALNLYTLGYNSNKQLSTLNEATKTNLATYLEQYRMLTDAINIKDAFIINFGLDFQITAFKSYNNQEVIKLNWRCKRSPNSRKSRINEQKWGCIRLLTIQI